jgi:hypothetical protein
MKDDKLVKLSAIEEMAKPMAEYHKGDDPEVEELCECPKCGHTFKTMRPVVEDNDEESEDY